MLSLRKAYIKSLFGHWGDEGVFYLDVFVVLHWEMVFRQRWLSTKGGGQVENLYQGSSDEMTYFLCKHTRLLVFCDQNCTTTGCFFVGRSMPDPFIGPRSRILRIRKLGPEQSPHIPPPQPHQTPSTVSFLLILYFFSHLVFRSRQLLVSLLDLQPSQFGSARIKSADPVSRTTENPDGGVPTSISPYHSL